MEPLAVDRIPRPGRREPRAGDLLVAAPALADPRFRRTVVYLLQHDEDGSAGVVLNRRFEHTLAGIGLPDWVDDTATVLAGGPVATDSLLALAPTAHTPAAARRALGPDVCVVDLEALTEDEPVDPLRMFVGYAGWGAGQLAGELAGDDWLVVGSRPQDVLTTDPEDVWATVLRRQPNATRLWATLPDLATAN